MASSTSSRNWLPTIWLLGIIITLVSCALQAGDAELQKGSTGKAFQGESLTQGAPEAYAVRDNTSQESPPAQPHAGSVQGESDTTMQSASQAPTLLDRGRQLFATQCAVCHGETGDGAGKFAYLMNPRPRNLKAGKFKLATTENQIPSDEDLMRTISRGMPGSAMPPWGHLPIATCRPSWHIFVRFAPMPFERN